MHHIVHHKILSLRYRLRTLLESLRNVRKRASLGFTLIELTISMAVLGTLAGVAIPTYSNYIEEAKIARAIAEIRILLTEILLYRETRGSLPTTLSDTGRGNLLDPWGNPYVYLNYDTVKGKGKIRKDHFTVPLNSDFDLYSMGKDGDSKAPLTAEASWDDIVLANDGEFIGIATEY